MIIASKVILTFDLHPSKKPEGAVIYNRKSNSLNLLTPKPLRHETKETEAKAKEKGFFQIQPIKIQKQKTEFWI